MNNEFVYLLEEDAKELKKTIISLINDVQDELRPDIIFSYHIIGSLSRNMVTRQLYHPTIITEYTCIQSIYYNKETQQYLWESQEDKYDLDDKIDWLKDNID